MIYYYLNFTSDSRENQNEIVMKCKKKITNSYQRGGNFEENNVQAI